VTSRNLTVHQRALHRIVIVGGGAAAWSSPPSSATGLAKRGKAQIQLIDKAPGAPVEAVLHEVAAGSMDLGVHELNYMAQSHWHHFRYRLGEMIASTGDGARCR